MLVDGQVIEGCNVENASFGLSMCAERVAAFSAVSRGLSTITRAAVSCVDAPSGSSAPARMPCGACRQVLSELGPPSMEVLVDGVGTFTLAELLPDAFVLDAG